MSDGPARTADRAAELRRAFDQSFAAPQREAADRPEHLLAVRVAGEPYAIRVSEIAGLAPAGRIVPLPTTCPELLGVAGMRGGLIAVYGLAALLGHGDAGQQPGWLVLCGTSEPIGLALQAYEGYLWIPRAEICAAGQAGRTHVRETARAGAASRPIIHVPSVVEAIHCRVAAAQRATATAQVKE